MRKKGDKGGGQERAAEFLRALSEAAATLTAASDEKAAMSGLIQALARLGLRPTLLILDPEDGRLHVRKLGMADSRIQRAVRLTGLDPATFSMPVNATEFHRRVMEDHETVYVEDGVSLAADVLPSRIRPLVRPLMRLLGYSSLILSPIVVDGAAEGFISVRHDQIDGSDTVAVALFTEQVSSAIGRLRMIESLREKNRLLEEAQARELSGQRLQAMGRLAGGIAHDFNNLLTVIISTAELMNHSLARNQEADPADLRSILDAALSGATLTRQLLDFARQRSGAGQPIDVNARLCALEPLLRRSLNPNIDLIIRDTGAPSFVRAEPGQFDQLVMNMAFNARDAMPDGGRLEIELLLRDDWIELHVRDTGSGMSPETLGRIFEPFFSTKARGQGTGLGLSTCYGIVTGWGGTIEVRSVIGEGTLIHADLPRVEAGPAIEASDEERAATTEARILLVEDEDMVRAVAARILRGYGFTVDAMPSAEEGLEAMRNSNGEYDLLLSDIVLPGMKGTALAQCVLSEFPQMAIVLMSGHLGEGQSPGALPNVPIVWKPFQPDELIQAIERAIGSGRATVSEPE